MKSKRTLIDPIPCFMQFWTNAINVVQNSQITDTFGNKIASNTLKVALLKIKSPNGSVLDYGDTTSCLVGEIHGFDSSYVVHKGGQYCEFCKRMCAVPAKKAAMAGGDKLIQFKIQMYNHMVEKHKLKGNKIDIKKIPKIKDMVC